MSEEVRLSSRVREVETLPATLEGPGREIARVRDRIRALAALDAPVLVTGEPGTGRRTVAELLHRSGSAGATTIRVATAKAAPAALPLRGTILLPDLEDLTDETQTWWRSRLAAGGLGARLIALAGPTFSDRVRLGGFDAELAARLGRFTLRLPALRERARDLPAIITRLSASASAELGRGPVTFTTGALRRLVREPWPGNFPELERLIERLVAFHPVRSIGLTEVEEELDDMRPSLEVFRERERSRERAELMRTLEETGGNVAETAQRMARSRPAIYRLVEKHGIALRRGR